MLANFSNAQLQRELDRAGIAVDLQTLDESGKPVNELGRGAAGLVLLGRIRADGTEVAVKVPLFHPSGANMGNLEKEYDVLNRVCSQVRRNRNLGIQFFTCQHLHLLELPALKTSVLIIDFGGKLSLLEVLNNIRFGDGLAQFDSGVSGVQLRNKHRSLAFQLLQIKEALEANKIN